MPAQQNLTLALHSKLLWLLLLILIGSSSGPAKESQPTWAGFLCIPWGTPKSTRDGKVKPGSAIHDQLACIHSNLLRRGPEPASGAMKPAQRSLTLAIHSKLKWLMSPVWIGSKSGPAKESIGRPRTPAAISPSRSQGAGRSSGQSSTCRSRLDGS
jgi:hypothetical protein